MEYFVKSNGNGNCLSIEHAGEFTECISKLKPGDTLYVLPGLYCYSNTITIELYGLKDAPIKIASYSDELPIFDFRKQLYEPGINNNGFNVIGDYIVLENLIIENSGYKGVFLNANNSILDNIEAKYCCDSGIQIKGENNIIMNCKSHHNFGYKTIYLERIAYGFSSDGISDKLNKFSGNEYINCEAYNNTDDGFDFFAKSSDETILIEKCKSFNNGKSVWNMYEHPRYNTDIEWFKQFKEEKTYTVFIEKRANISIEKYPSFSKGCGYKLGGRLNKQNFVLKNCIAENNKQYGFHRNTNIGNIKLNDCTSKENMIKDFNI